jgi:hypothetical protein
LIFTTYRHGDKGLFFADKFAAVLARRQGKQVAGLLFRHPIGYLVSAPLLRLYGSYAKSTHKIVEILQKLA